MSLSLEFEPHSWYMEFAIKPENNFFKAGDAPRVINPFKWTAVTDNGMTGYIDTLEANTLKDLKALIRDYYERKNNPLYRSK